MKICFIGKTRFTVGIILPGRLQVFDDQLEIAARLVKTYARAREHLVAVVGRKAQQQPLGSEQGTSHLGVGVFEAEIEMP